MILPINDKPQVRTYSHHAYINSIVDLQVLLELEVLNYSANCWNEQYVNIDASRRGNLFTFYSIGNGEIDSKFRFERKIEKYDEVQFEIKTIKNVQRNAKIILYISTEKCAEVYCDMLFSLTIHRYGYTTDERGVNRKNFEYSFEQFPYVKVSYQDGTISVLISRDRNVWITIDKYSCFTHKSEFVWGVMGINLDNNEYTEWLMNNYIHISFDQNADITQVYLDYAVLPSKNMCYEYAHASQFLDITYLPAKVIAECDVVSYLKNCIENGYYVAIAQDEYHIPNRKYFHRKHRFHHNLYYGYDVEDECFNILGYGTAFAASKLPVKESYRAGVSKEANIILYRRNMSEIPFTFSIDSFIKALSDYLQGHVPYEYMRSLIGFPPLVYGLKVYDSLAETDKGLWVACFDNRAAFLLYEHSVLWNKRIGFLQQKGYIKKNSSIKAIAKELLLISEKLLFFVQKNMVSTYDFSFGCDEEVWKKFDEKNIKEKTKRYIFMMKSVEEQLICQVLEELKEYEN